MSFDHLNDEQRKAVTHPAGPALVLAGAGSGKTRVIVERIVWLIGEQGVDARNILALTFTNRAAGEMKERVARRLDMPRVPAWVGTFHAFGLFLLRREMDELGRAKTFTIFDDSDQLALMKRLIKALPPKQQFVSPREALSWVSALKSALEMPDEPEDEREEVLTRLWEQYHEALLQANAVDFDDLLVMPARLLAEYDGVRARYRSRYKHILVDEYQDTNHAQYEIVRLLAGDEGNVFVVGDEDQSIYSWRGADISNILNFSRDFSGAETYRLEQNYRSTRPILDAANAVVANNEHRLGKNLWTQAQEGQPVAVYVASSGEDEARFVAERIQQGGALRESAVLFRTNGQARIIEEAFRKKGVPYRVVGGIRFYSRKEIKDILAYLRLLVNPTDDESLRRIINVPPRRIGAKTLEAIEEYAGKRSISLLEALREMEQYGGVTKLPGEVTGFLYVVDDLTVKAKSPGVLPIVESLLEKTGYRDYVRKADEKDYRTRLEIIDEFLQACAEADGDKGVALDAFLQELSLLTDVDDWDPEAEAATLMTCHSAKGLEFDHVYLVGLEEGLLPHASTFGDRDEIEEERRLCYVSMTRARKTLTLCAARFRRVFGEGRDSQPSRFLEEIPAGQLHVIKREISGAERKSIPAGPSADPAVLKTGTRVRHASFGVGTVMYTKGTGAKLRARIRFQTGRIREFMVSKTPLEIVEARKG